MQNWRGGTVCSCVWFLKLEQSLVAVEIENRYGDHWRQRYCWLGDQGIDPVYHRWQRVSGKGHVNIVFYGAWILEIVVKLILSYELSWLPSELKFISRFQGYSSKKYLLLKFWLKQILSQSHCHKTEQWGLKSKTCKRLEHFPSIIETPVHIFSRICLLKLKIIVIYSFVK